MHILIYDSGILAILVSQGLYPLHSIAALTSLEDVYYCTWYLIVPPGERADGALVSVYPISFMYTSSRSYH
jgi:hypothetical protein